MAFDPGEPLQRRYTGYGPAALPDARDRELDEFVEGLRSGASPAVEAARAAVSAHGRDVLGAYAERAATRAVRNAESERLVLALVALVVAGLVEDDHEALLSMALIEDAADRLGIEAAELFGEAADIVGHPGSVSLMRWLARPPADRTLEAMGFVAGEDESGFRYLIA